MFSRVAERPPTGPAQSFLDLEAVLPVRMDGLVAGGGEPAEVLLLHPPALCPKRLERRQVGWEGAKLVPSAI
jgi:hypothetical protein